MIDLIKSITKDVLRLNKQLGITKEACSNTIECFSLFSKESTGMTARYQLLSHVSVAFYYAWLCLNFEQFIFIFLNKISQNNVYMKYMR